MFGLNVEALNNYVIGEEMLDILTYGKLRGQYGARGNYLTNEHLWSQKMEDQWNKVFEENAKDRSTLLVYVSRIVELTIKYVPIDTGQLFKSMYIKDYTNSKGQKATEIGFDCKYAKYVHEIPFYHHQYPTRYKFLEQAALETAEEFGLIYPLAMSYSPLRLYVNEEEQGENLHTIMDRKLHLEEHKQETYNKFIKQFMEYEKIPTSHHMPEIGALIFGRYMKYWRERQEQINVVPNDIAAAFLEDRMRHKFTRDWAGKDFDAWLLDQGSDDSFAGLMKDWRRYLT